MTIRRSRATPRSTFTRPTYVTKNIQLYGLVNNLFDAHYGLFGNFYNLEAANSAAAADPATGNRFFTNPRTITPSPPTTAYGGVRVRF